MKKIIMILVATLIVYSMPASAAVFSLDPAHTTVSFSIEHLVISNVKGLFATFEGEFEVVDNNKLTNVNAVIKTASIDTKIKKRDDHLRSADFFDVEKYPTMTFKTTSVKHNGGNKFTLSGDLTIHGITKTVSFDGGIRGPIKDPWGNTRTGITVTGTIKRKDFGLKWNKVLEGGGLVVGDMVTINVEGEGILKK